MGNANKISKEALAKLQAQIGDRKTSRSENYWEYQRICPETYQALKVIAVFLVTDSNSSISCSSSLSHTLRHSLSKIL